MSDNLTSMLYRVILFGVINLAIRIALRRPLVSAAFAFWFAWGLLLIGGKVAVANGWRDIGTYSAPYLNNMFNGAFVGFMVASFTATAQKSRSSYLGLISVVERILVAYSRKILLALFLVGMIFLLQRIATVGLSTNYLSEVRTVYNERQGGFLLRIGSYLSVMTATLIIMRGLVDSYRGVNLRALVLVILAGAPLGLANGGRAFLMSYTLAYLASLLLARSYCSRLRFGLTTREMMLLGGLISALLFIFASMGFSRGGYGVQFNIFYTILIWPVSTLQAMDSWVSVAINGGRTYGLNTFGWVFDLLGRLKLLDISSFSAVMRDTAYYFQDMNNSAVVIPRSILPDLIFDFGPQLVFPSIAIIAFLLEFAISRSATRGIFLHVLATQSLLGSFMTIQNSVISPGFAVSLFWGAVFAFVVRQNRRKKR